MAERKVEVILPTGKKGVGVPVQVAESTERWSEFTLQDGTIMRTKASVLSATRVDGEYDQDGNPIYSTNVTPLMIIVSTPEHLRQKKP